MNLHEISSPPPGEAHQSADDAAALCPDIHGLRTQISNVFLVQSSPEAENDWVLIDAGLASGSGAILDTAKRHFGESSSPLAIVLTHGHFDHVGALGDLLKHWDVPVYAHEQELPYLTGERDYPPPDPSVGGGLMSFISPIYPRHAIQLGPRVRALPNDGSVPGLPHWRWIHTPGHTEGHVSLFRDADQALIAGDAFITVRQESLFHVLAQDPELHGPPAYFTPNWDAARESVRKLEALHPSVAYCGHGVPLTGEALNQGLRILARDFDEVARPKTGRYVH